MYFYKDLVPMSEILTGDPSNNNADINSLTRLKKEERQNIFSNLPQRTQEMLIPKPTFFDGISSNAEMTQNNQGFCII